MASVATDIMCRRAQPARRPEHRCRGLPVGRQGCDRPAGQRQRRALSREGRRARNDPLLRGAHGRAPARAARAAARVARARSSRTSSTLHYQPQARIGGETIGFEALVRWHHPIRGVDLAGHVHPARRGKRPDRRDGRMDSARGLPRSGVLAEAAAGRRQPVAGPVPPRRPAGAGARRSCWKPGSRRTASSSRSPKAC